MDKIEQTLNRHLPIRHQFQEPIKARRSKKPLTFANLITEDEASKHYGFIYLAMVNGKSYYVGSKELHNTKDWRTYTSSSEYVKDHIKKGSTVTWKVLEYVNNSTFLRSTESKWIYKLIRADRENILNIVDAQGDFLPTYRYNK
jgi:hypothetical protein